MLLKNAVIQWMRTSLVNNHAGATGHLWTTETALNTNYTSF